MADKKITQLETKGTPETVDLVEIVDDPSGTPISKKATLQNVVGKVLSSTSITDNWNIDGSDTLYVDKANGRVGIGTTSPGYKLEINGSGLKDRLYIYDGGTNGVRYSYDGLESTYLDAPLYIGGSGYIKLTTYFDGTWHERVRINNDGYVGIGNDDPTYALDIFGTGLNSASLKTFRRSDDSFPAYIRVFKDRGGTIDTADDDEILRIEPWGRSSGDLTEGGFLSFQKESSSSDGKTRMKTSLIHRDFGGSLTTMFSIDRSGSSEHVCFWTKEISNGNMPISKSVLKLRRSSSTTGELSVLSFVVASSGEGGAAIAHERTGGWSQGKLHFGTKSSIKNDSTIPIRMTIDQNGNVGIGNTEPDTILDINGALTQRPLSADPSDPDAGNSVMWVSDGTGSGDEGDVMMKITVGETTKTITLVDYSNE
jgi:hypothetical protein